MRAPLRSLSLSLSLALALALSLAPSLARAQQNTVAEAPPVSVTVVVETPPPPPPVIVVVEPPPPPIIVVEEPPPPPPPPPPEPAPSSPPSRGPRFVLDLTGDFVLGAGYDPAALGGTARPGLVFDGGWTGMLAIGYEGTLFDGASDVHLGVEVQRDFSPSHGAAFLLLARVGTAFLLDQHDAFDPGIRLDGQLGVGGRFDLSSDVAFLTELRGVIRFRPDDPSGPDGRDVSGGLLLSVGLRIRL